MRDVHIQCTAEQRHFIATVLYNDDARHIAFGGARGGNKSFSGALAMVLCLLRWPGASGLALRKTKKATARNLKKEVDKVCKMLGITPKYHATDQIFTFHNGSTLELKGCMNEESYTGFIGMEYTFIWWEEAVQHLQEAISLVNSSLRNNVPNCIPKIWYTTNPGGASHDYFLTDFVEEETRKEGNYWIPSTLRNALPTLVNDPGYLDHITKGLSAFKRQQWIEGNWKAMAGAYFNVEPETTVEMRPPYYADWYGGVDYGDEAPFCSLWAAKWQDERGVDHIHFVSEIYQARLGMDEQAEKALEREEELRDEYGINGTPVYYADPTVNNRIPAKTSDIDKTIKQVWASCGWTVVPSGKALRSSSLHVMKMLMRDNVMTISPSGCPALIKEIKGAHYENPDNPRSEDISDKCPDHAITACYYLLRRVFLNGYRANPIDAYAYRKGEAA